MNVQLGAGLPHYQSAVSFQRGHGLGGLLGKFIKSIIPLVKQPIVRKTLKRIGTSALKSGLSAVQEKVNNPNSNLKANLKKEVRRNLKYAFRDNSIKNKSARQPNQRKKVLTKQGKKATLLIPKRKSRQLDIFDFQ